MDKRIKDTNTTLKILGFYQVFGGIIGLVFIGWLLLRVELITGSELLFILMAIGLYSFSVLAGKSLLDKNSRGSGLIYSIINNGLQIIAFSSINFEYGYYSGLKGTFGINLTTGFQFEFGAGLSEFNFAFGNEPREHFFCLNIIAIIIVYVLYDIYKELKNDSNNEAELIADFGVERTDEKI